MCAFPLRSPNFIAQKISLFAMLHAHRDRGGALLQAAGCRGLILGDVYAE
jgi:hypothetical protein